MKTARLTDTKAAAIGRGNLIVPRGSEAGKEKNRPEKQS